MEIHRLMSVRKWLECLHPNDVPSTNLDIGASDVIPADAGIWVFRRLPDPGLRRADGGADKISRR